MARKTKREIVKLTIDNLAEFEAAKGAGFVKLPGKFVWRCHKNYTTNFGWCLYAADETAKAAVDTYHSHLCTCIYPLVDVEKKDGSVKTLIFDGSRCYDDNPYLLWEEYPRLTEKRILDLNDFRSRCEQLGEKVPTAYISLDEFVCLYEARKQVSMWTFNKDNEDYMSMFPEKLED